MLTLAIAKPRGSPVSGGSRRENRCRGLALALGGLLATTGTALAAFQVVHLSMTSGEPGAEVEIRVDASQLIGGTEQSEAFLVPQDAYDASPEPARHRACWDNDCKLTTPVADPVKGTA